MHKHCTSRAATAKSRAVQCTLDEYCAALRSWHAVAGMETVVQEKRGIISDITTVVFHAPVSDSNVCPRGDAVITARIGALSAVS